MKISRNKLKKELEQKIADIYYFNSGYHKLNATWCKAKITDIKETDKGYACNGKLTVGKDNDGDGESWTSTNEFENILVSKSEQTKT